MATSCSLEEILEKQCEKLRHLETATIFTQSKNAVKDEVIKMYKQVLDMDDGIDIMRKRLDEMKEQNKECMELLLLIKALDEKIIHMEKNVPSKPICDYQNINNSVCMTPLIDDEIVKKSLTIIESDTEEQQTPMKDCKKILFNEPEVCPMIPLITEEEFNTIPKYIIGRHPIETVNNFINTINQVLKAKYTFLSHGKAHARKQGYLNLYLHYKKQELDVCTNNECLYFFMGSDYERYAKLKLDKIRLNLLTVLRHCKRLREYRVKNHIHYVVQTKQ